MSISSLIALTMQQLGCTQKELATRLNVSPTQITKWKKGEYISFEMQEKLKELAKIGEMEPSFVLLAGSIENAKQWTKLISILAELANENAETGYNTSPLIDETDLISADIFNCLGQINYPIPKNFPVELEHTLQGLDNTEDIEELLDSIENNQFCNLIYQILQAYTDIYGFYSAYIAALNFETIEYNLELSEIIGYIESDLIALALVKTEIPLLDRTEFKIQTIQNYQRWITLIKKKALQLNIPLKAELMHLVSDSHNELGIEAEAESLGFNENRLHPDIYMNELLQGMRLIHQVLPVILKKLDIEDFEINQDM